MNAYTAFKLLTETEDRQNTFRQWVIQSFLFFGVASLVSLSLIGHISALWKVPEPFIGLVQGLNGADSEDKEAGFFGGMILALQFLWLPVLVIVGTVAALGRSWAAHCRILNGKEEKSSAIVIGDIEAMIPRNKKERFWTTLLSLNAGFSEELFFRLLIPLMVWITTGNVWLAIVFSTLFFWRSSLLSRVVWHHRLHCIWRDHVSDLSFHRNDLECSSCSRLTGPEHACHRPMV